MGPFALRSGIRKTLRGKAALNLPSFFTELRRHNVYKVAIAYAVIAWLLMQIVSQIMWYVG